MNLLIAIVGDSYEKVKESERMQALRERAQIIAEAERTHPSWHRYHRYMHIAEAADISSSGARRDLEWEGITGRVKQLLAVQTAEVEGRRVDSKFAEAKVDTQSKFEELKSHVDSNSHVMDSKFVAMDSKLEEVKGLLNTLLDHRTVK